MSDPSREELFDALAPCLSFDEDLWHHVQDYGSEEADDAAKIDGASVDLCPPRLPELAMRTMMERQRDQT